MKKYSEFDYKKALAILKVLEKEVKEESKGYVTLCLSNFDNKSNSSIQYALNGFPNKKIMYISLIYTFIELDNQPFMSFEMFEDKCYVNIKHNYNLNKKEKKIFAKIRPFKKVRFRSWEEALAIFLNKTHIIIRDKLKIIDDDN